MTTPELVLQVKEQMEKLSVAEQGGLESDVISQLSELRELLNNQPVLEAGGA